MLRVSTLRIPVAIVAAGTLLCGCAASSSGGWPIAAPAPTVTSASTPSSAPSSRAAEPLPVLVLPALPEARSAARTPAKPPAPRKTVYLTFDDGPSATYTKQILAVLDQYDAKATFFVIGRQTKHAKATLHAEYDAGHGVANHTWDHRNLRRVSGKRFKAEVGGTQNAIKAATGHAPVCLRPPGGASNKKVKARAKKYGLHIKLWDVDAYDWKHPGTKKIVARTVKHVHDGSVVLLHDGGGNRKQTVAALPFILRALQAKGYRFAAMCR